MAAQVFGRLTPDVDTRQRRMLEGAAIAYLAGLTLWTSLVCGLGEGWWLSSVAAYAPRLPLGFPLLVLVPLLWKASRRLLWTQLAAAWLWLFPLCGLVLPTFGSARAGKLLRVMSYNADNCAGSWDGMVESVRGQRPDVALLQEVCFNAQYVADRLRADYQVARLDGQFLLASRFPVRDLRVARFLDGEGRERADHAIGYSLETELGPITFVSVHPVSPRPAFLKMWRAFRQGAGLASFRNTMRSSDELRLHQLQSAVQLARESQGPVVLAGDFNLAGSTPAWSRLFGAYRDGFQSAGAGLGYTFPAPVPWLRLDRVLASKELELVGFERGCKTGSDHYCVIATLQRAP